MLPVFRATAACRDSRLTGEFITPQNVSIERFQSAEVGLCLATWRPQFLRGEGGDPLVD